MKENCQSPGVPEKENVSATFPVFRTSIVYVTESPAGINRRWEASHVIATERETTFASRRSTIASAWRATDAEARYVTDIPFSVPVFTAVTA